ncbi:MAG: 3-isopropylmalate dehydrogenase [Calditrichaeota bacterium]|nr:3-isopropylmalate dehydrogenase [Calditrichota bacterium]TDI85162.1 MAG: 3-isopropylmalate dehydrogenase [Caldithrix sp.]
MARKKRIAVIPGDGIGIDVTVEAIKVLDAIREKHGLDIEVKDFDYGAERYLRDGTTMPEEQVEDFRSNYDALYIGALGDPRVPDMAHARDILLGLRFKLDLFVNYRPIKLTDQKLCPLKNKTEADIDFVVFRENTEGLYVGMGGIFKKGTPDEIAIQEDVNTRKGVERIIRYAFEFAKEKGRPKVTMSDKSNALRFGHDLWLRTFEEVGAEYPDIEKEHIYVDALTMQLIKRPEQFEVIVTCNMFGDIVTDLGAQLQGGLGLAASGNINPDGTSMFEPVHGSAPKYAGKNVANPLAAILTLGLLLDYLGYSEQNGLVEKAVAEAIKTNNTTKDLGGNLGTKQVGDFICGMI